MNIFLIFLDNNKQSYESTAQIGSISKSEENDLQQTKPHKLSLQWFKKYYIAPILRHSPDIFRQYRILYATVQNYTDHI